MTEQFLNRPQVSAALDQMRGGGVPKAVRAKVGHAIDSRKPLVNHAPS